MIFTALQFFTAFFLRYVDFDFLILAPLSLQFDECVHSDIEVETIQQLVLLNQLLLASLFFGVVCEFLGTWDSVKYSGILRKLQIQSIQIRRHPHWVLLLISALCSGTVSWRVRREVILALRLL